MACLVFDGKIEKCQLTKPSDLWCTQFAILYVGEQSVICINMELQAQ